MDQFYNRDKVVAFKEALRSISVFDPLRPDPNVLCRLIGLLNTCEAQFGNQDVTLVIRSILQKLGNLAHSFISAYPNENTWSLRKLNSWIQPFFNHYRVQAKPPP